MFPENRGGSRPAPSPKPNTEILITCLGVFLKLLSQATGLSDHKSPGWWQRRMWGALPVLAVGTWSSDAQANSCAGWGQWTHMFGQEEMLISPPDRGREETEHPSSVRALDRQQVPPRSQGVSEAAWPRWHRGPAQAESVEGRVLHLPRAMVTMNIYTGLPSSTHTLVTIPVDSGSTQTTSIAWLCDNPPSAG